MKAKGQLQSRHGSGVHINFDKTITELNEQIKGNNIDVVDYNMWYVIR